MSLNTKYDTEIFNSTAADISANKQNYKLAPHKTKSEKFKKIISCSPYNLDTQDKTNLNLHKAKSEQTAKVKKDTDYCEIVKKYSIEKRTENKTKPTRSKNQYLSKHQTTPIKTIQQIRTNISFSTTPKHKKFVVGGKDVRPVNKFSIKRCSSTVEDTPPSEFVSERS